MQPIDTQITGTKCEVQSDTHVDRVRLSERIGDDVADPLDSAPKPKKEAFPSPLPPPGDQPPLLTTAPPAHNNDTQSNEATASEPELTASNSEKKEARAKRIIEIRKRWRAANLEKLREQQRMWYAANREKVSTQKRMWSRANREQVNERNRKWRAANREKISE